jgi:hypothetical protein
MTGEAKRTLRACTTRSQTLRDKGFTYTQIADVLALDHDASPLRLYRYAHGLTTPQVVDTFNELDPAGTATLRDTRLRDYEAWPATGRRPPAWILALLARIYHTNARNLVTDQVYASYSPADQDTIDHADHRHLDETTPTLHAKHQVPAWKEPPHSPNGAPPARRHTSVPLCYAPSTPWRPT